MTLAGLSVCHAHDPVGAPEMVIAAVAGFMKKLEEDVLVRHELPWAALPVNRIHRCRVGLPGCARPLARYLHVMASVLWLGCHTGVLMWLLCPGCRCLRRGIGA